MIGYVGADVEQVEAIGRRRRAALLSLSFFTGLVLSILVLGILASLFGRLFSRWAVAFAILAAGLSFASGLAALFASQLRVRFSNPRIRERGGVAGAFLYGLSYTLASVSTGAGPLLLLLTVTAAIHRPLYGAALSLSYALGRGLPFLILGIFAGAAARWVAKIEGGRRAAELASGVVLVGMGGYFLWLAFTLSGLTSSA